jgi:hypothetical protein
MTREYPLLRAMSHPVVVGAVALLIANDHLLKSSSPSWITGKLSDVAGVVFFPILAAALLELVTRNRINTRITLAISIAITGVLFAGLQLSSAVGAGYELAMGLLQWPFRLFADPSAQLVGVQITPDPTDLFALPAMLMAWRIVAPPSERANRPKASTESPPAV